MWLELEFLVTFYMKETLALTCAGSILRSLILKYHSLPVIQFRKKRSRNIFLEQVSAIDAPACIQMSPLLQSGFLNLGGFDSCSDKVHTLITDVVWKR